MNNTIKLAVSLSLALIASQLGGCTTSGARPAYHISNYNYADAYWGGYGYRRVGYVGYTHRHIGRPAYYGGGYRRVY